MKDIDGAWSEVQQKVHDERSSLEHFVAKERLREGVEIQEFQLSQVSKKREESMKIYDDFNEINEMLAKIRQEDEQKEIDIQREKLRRKKIVDDELKVS